MMCVKVIIFLSSLLVELAVSQNLSHCDIEGINDVAWDYSTKKDFNDNQVKEQIFVSKYTGNIANLSWTCSTNVSTCDQYINFSTNDTHFYMETTEKFRNFDVDMLHLQDESKNKFTITCSMNCQDPKQLSSVIFLSTVSDYNEHPPEFSEGDRTYKVASPIMPKTDFSFYGASITATDMDFSNTEIKFFVDPPDFDVISTVNTSTIPATFTANFRAKEIKQIMDPVKYTIMAIDSGTLPGPKNSTIEITLTLDESSTLETPTFVYTGDSLFYSFQYEKNDTLTPLGGEITLKTNKPSQVKNVKLEGDLADHFTATYNPSSSQITLSVQNKVDNPVSSYNVLNLNLETDYVASTPVIIYFPDAPDSTPKFSQHFYTAKYNDISNTVTLDQEIKILSSGKDDPVVDISGDLSNHFIVSLSSDKKTYDIIVKTPLTTDEINSVEYLKLTIEATVDSKSDTSGVIITLPSHNIQFTEILYSATYNDNNTVNVDKDHPIAFTSDVTAATVNVDDKYSTYFKVSVTKNNCVLSVENPLPANVLNSQAEIALTITASDKYKSQARAVVKISLPIEESLKAPKFSDSYYVVQYNEGDTGYLDFNKSLAFDNVDDPTKVHIVLSTYNTNFEVVYNSNKWRINVKNPLDHKIFTEATELPTNLIAVKEADGDVAQGESVLIIELIGEKDDVPPKFTDSYYVAKYEKSQTDYIDFDKALLFDNIADISKVTIAIDDYNDNFQIVYESEKWKIKIKKPLDATVFDTISDIVITMEASETGVSGKGVGILVIELSDNAPRFSDPCYTVQYKTGQTGFIDFDTAVNFKNVADMTKVSIALDVYKDNFELVYVSQKWRIKIKKPLEATVFDTISDIMITMEATEIGITGKGIGILVIELLDKAPEFSNTYYIVQYKKGQTDYIDFNSAVTFTNVEDMATVSISLEDYKDNFELVYESKKWRIKINKPLDATVFDTLSDVVISMEASEIGLTKKGVSVLIIELSGGSSTDNGPEFSNPHYTVQYKKGQTDYIDFNTALTFTNVADVTTVSISLEDYKDNFEFVYESKKWRIKINKPLNATVFDTLSDVVISMEASEIGLTKKGVSVLVIELSGGSSTDTAPEFSDAYYTVQYKKGQTDYIDFNTALTFTNVADMTTVSISLEDYKDHFELVYKSKKWRIKINKPLDATVFDTISDIVISMEASEIGLTKKGVSVLVIELSGGSSTDTAPEFSNAYYKVQFIKNQSGYIDIDPVINFKNVDEISKVSIVLKDYLEYFEISYHSNKWQFHIKNPLPDTIFDSNQELITAMEVSENNVKGTGVTALLIQLEHSSIDGKIPEFRDAFYSADYPESSESDIPFSTTVKFVNVDDPSKVTISLNKYSKNFKIVYESDNKEWQIHILIPLEDTILNGTDPYLLDTLTAKIDDKTKSPTAAFVLNLHKREAPIFSKTYYKANYAVEGSKAVVALDSDIDFSNVPDNSKISITADEYSSFFTFNYDKKWHIQSKLLSADLLNVTDLTVAITATDNTNGLKGHSLIDLKLPSTNTDGAPKFSKSYYTGRYEISGEKATVTLDDDIKITNRKDMTNIKITTDKYTENFVFLFNDGKWSVTVPVKLDQSVLNSNIDIIIALISTDDSNAKEIGESALVLTLPIINDDKGPQFSQIFYNSSCNSKTTMLEAPIQIKNNKDPSKVTISFLENEYRENFEITLNTEKSSWFIKVKSLPDVLMSDKNDLILTLTVTENGNKNIGLAPFIITYIVTPSPKFSKDQYYGTYSDDGDALLDIEDFTIVNKDDLSIITLDFNSTDSDFSKNFIVNFNSSAKTWKMSLINPLEDSQIKGKTEIVLTLFATEKENSNIGISTIIINLTNTNDENDISFTELHYAGVYDDTSEKPVVILDKEIQITSNQDTSAAVVTIKTADNIDPAKYFDLTKDGDHYNLIVRNPLTPEIIEKQRSIVMTLEADLNASKGYATLVVNLPAQNTENSIKFDRPVYDTYYNVSLKGEIQYKSVIAKIISDEESANIQVSISKDSLNGEYFTLSRKDKDVEVINKNILPPNIYREVSLITLTLEAKISDSNILASTVVNIKINYENYQGYLTFDSLLYMGKYEIKDKAATVEIDPIKLTTDKPDDVEISVGNVFKDFFSANINNSDLSVHINKIKDLTPSLVNNISTVTIMLNASIRDTNVTAGSIVNLRILNDDTPTPDTTGVIKFDDFIYTASYSIQNGVGSLKVDRDIKVTTDRTNDEIDTSITDDLGLKDYFSSSYSNQVITIKILNNLPDDIFLSRPFVSLTLTASIKGTDQNTNAVLTIQFENGQNNDTEHISFSSPIYNAIYEITNNIANIPDCDNILIDTDQEDKNITISVIKGLDKYFKSSYSDKMVTLSLVSNIASDSLRGLNNVPVVLLAKIVNAPQITAETVVNFKVIDQDSGNNSDNSTVTFSKLLYQGNYTLKKDHSVDFHIDEIDVIQDRPDDQIDISIKNEYGYQKYFMYSYENGQITVNSKEVIPERIIDEMHFLAFTLEASVKNKTSIYSEAILNIQLNGITGHHNQNETTKYIIAISILTIFIILILLAAGAYYYFRFRRLKYNKMEEEDYIKQQNLVRFNKNSLRHSGDKVKRSSALENRRPTAYISNINILDEELGPRESSTDLPDMKERKKSVAFDENVEKLQLDTNDDDLDKTDEANATDIEKY